VSYRPRLEPRALRQMAGLPDPALDTLVRLLARICDDPYDPVFSSPGASSPGERVADLGESGFVEFEVDEDAGLIRVYDLVWTG
jgi:hypothetical protein